MGKEQVILGVQGFSRRTHNASAAILVDGQLVAMAEEERFSRRKNAFGEVPHNSMAFCLKQAGVTIDDVDGIALGWDFNQVFRQIGAQPPSEEALQDLYLPKDRFKHSKKPEITMFPHHQAHAASSYYLSGFDRALIMVVDGQGESQATSIFLGKGPSFELVKEFGVTDSLGYFYEGVSEYVGLTRLDAGKTMGLASYGRPNSNFSLLRLTDDGYNVQIDQPQQREMDLQGEVTRGWTEFLKKEFGDPNRAEFVFDDVAARFVKQLDFDQRYKDVASSGQKALELVAHHLVNTYARRLNQQNLCIAGGVGLNCSMNGSLARSGLVKDVFIPPFSNDAGVSVGAALLLSDKKPTKRLDTASLGPEFTNQAIAETLNKLGITYTSPADISTEVAKLIADNNIVDWFQGRMEVGPRALGNRSTLGNPANKETHTKLNEVKNREQWRPLAPSFLAEALSGYVTDSGDSPFMLKAFTANERMGRDMPAAVHVDGTTRAQTVTAEANPAYYRMIKQFENQTGMPAVMNTSFNLDDEPIVCSPYNAVRTFFASGADYLAIGDMLVSKK
jgi:carbamoyltransferase